MFFCFKEGKEMWGVAGGRGFPFFYCGKFFNLVLQKAIENEEIILEKFLDDTKTKLIIHN